MSKSLLHSFLLTPTLLSAFFLLTTQAIALEPQSAKESTEATALDLEIVEPDTTEFTQNVSIDAFTQSADPISATPSPISSALSSNALVDESVDESVASTLSVSQLSITASETPSEASSAIAWESDPMAQLTSVSQLSDVSPTDWAYTAVQSLVEKYGCIVGYPDGTFRGQRSLTRFEFAAGLNACMDQINTLISEAGSDLATREDLEILQRLAEEFAAELATLRGRVDALEGRVSELEANQFSTTTKLHGEVIMSLDDLFDDDGFEGNNTVFRSRIRLDFVTSFTGEDALHARLESGNVIPFTTPGAFPNINEGTKEALFVSRVGGVTERDIVLDWLAYYFPIGDRIDAYVAGTGGAHSDYVFSTISPYFEDYDGGNGSITTFSQSSPIYRIGGGAGAGLSISFDDNDVFILSLGYLADEASVTSAGSGIFNGDYAALGQLTITPSDNFQIGLTYVHGYHTDDNYIFDSGYDDDFFVGTVPASATHAALGIPAVSNSYGVEASLQISPNFVINAFGGYTDLIFINAGDGEVWYYGMGLAFPDLFGEGNLGGIMVGVEPYLGSTNVTLFDLAVENDTSLHLEAFYKFQLNDNISITPGIAWITAPDQNSSNSDFVTATVRTTFSF
jgi:hypothetical protein